MKLSILMPVYNEVKTLSGIIDLILFMDLDKELIIADDGSNDGTRELLEQKYKGKPGINIIFHEQNLGKGAAIQTTLKHAIGDYAIIQDADMEYNPHDYRIMLDIVKREAAEVVFGSRFAKTWRSTSFLHYLVNWFLTTVFNILFGTSLTDMETCYKMIRTDIFKDLGIKAKHFEIEPEISAKLIKRGLKIREVGISYQGRGYHEGKKITWKDGLYTLWSIFKYRLM
ncbi:glycosyltransferase family 2 protein [Candidatus Omnitrophota bacterium]